MLIDSSSVNIDESTGGTRLVSFTIWFDEVFDFICDENDVEHPQITTIANGIIAIIKNNTIRHIKPDSILSACFKVEKKKTKRIKIKN